MSDCRCDYSYICQACQIRIDLELAIEKEWAEKEELRATVAALTDEVKRLTKMVEKMSERIPPASSWMKY